MEKLKVTNKYSYLNENFKPFSALSEDTFSVTKDGLEDLKDFIDDDITDETVDIIDTEASTEDELQDSYIGKIILDCNVCHSKLYKDAEDIHVDEESNSVNIDEECPYCYSTDGYKIVGKVVPYDEDTCEDYCDTEISNDKDLYKTIDIEKLNEKINSLNEAEMSDEDRYDTEVLKNIYKKIQNRANAKLTDDEKAVLDKYNLIRDNKDIFTDRIYDSNKNITRINKVIDAKDLDNDKINLADRARKLSNRDSRDRTYAEIERQRVNDMKQELNTRKVFTKELDYDDARYADAIKKAKAKYRRDKNIHQSLVDDSNKNINKLLKKESLDSDLAKYQKWVDYDMKRYGRISDKTNNLIKRAGLTIIKDQYGDYEVTDHSPITEDLDEIEIKGNGQKIKVKDDEITIKTCDKDVEEVELKDTEEVIAPLDDEEIAEIDDFDEEDFEELSERYLTEVYNNVNSFKLSKASLNKEGKLKLEGIVTFKSGNKRKTAFLFEKKNSLKSGKIKYIGENLDFSNGRKSFILNCSINNKKLISESLTYNYTVKDNNGQSKRLYGTVRRNK